MGTGRTRRARVEIEGKDELSRPANKAASSFEKFGKTVRNVVGALGGLAAARAVVNFLEETTQVAGRAEQSFNALSASIERNGNTFPGAAEQVREWSESLEELTGISKESLETNFILAQSFGADVPDAIALATAAADFAAGAFLSTEEALRRLGRATQGSTEDVAKFIPELKDLNAEQITAAKLAELVSKRFGGAAEAIGNEGYTGAVNAAATAQKSFNEEIGKLNLDERTEQLKNQTLSWRVLRDTISSTKEAVTSTTNIIDRSKSRFLGYSATISIIIKQFRDWIRSMRSQTEETKKLGDEMERLKTLTEIQADAARRAALANDRASEATKLFADEAKLLGFTLNSELTAEIERNNDFLEQARERVREYGDGWEELARVESFVTERNAELRAQIQGVTEDTQRSTEAIDIETRALEVNAAARGVSINSIRTERQEREASAASQSSIGDPLFPGISGGQFTVTTPTVRSIERRFRRFAGQSAASVDRTIG